MRVPIIHRLARAAGVALCLSVAWTLSCSSPGDENLRWLACPYIYVPCSSCPYTEDGELACTPVCKGHALEIADPMGQRWSAPATSSASLEPQPESLVVRATEIHYANTTNYTFRAGVPAWSANDVRDVAARLLSARLLPADRPEGTTQHLGCRGGAWDGACEAQLEPVEVISVNQWQDRYAGLPCSITTTVDLTLELDVPPDVTDAEWTERIEIEWEAPQPRRLILEVPVRVGE